MPEVGSIEQFTLVLGSRKRRVLTDLSSLIENREDHGRCTDDLSDISDGF